MMQAYRINRAVKLAFETVIIFMRLWKECHLKTTPTISTGKMYKQI